MLKIGNVSWKGRCGRHPMYDPIEDGEGGIRGGCQRCYALLEIHRQHAALVRSIREFGPMTERRKPERSAAAAAAEFQFSLFEMQME